MPHDPFAAGTDSLIAPARHAFAITPHDTLELSQATKAIYVGTGGDIALRMIGSDEDVVLRNVVSGTVLALRIRSVRLTGTDAADLIGLI